MDNDGRKLHPIAADLILTMQKRPFLEMLRQWRKESDSKIEINLLNEVIEAITDGDFDG